MGAGVGFPTRFRHARAGGPSRSRRIGQFPAGLGKNLLEGADRDGGVYRPTSAAKAAACGERLSGAAGSRALSKQA